MTGTCLLLSSAGILRVNSFPEKRRSVQSSHKKVTFLYFHFPLSLFFSLFSLMTQTSCSLVTTTTGRMTSSIALSCSYRKCIPSSDFLERLLKETFSRCEHHHHHQSFSACCSKSEELTRCQEEEVRKVMQKTDVGYFLGKEAVFPDEEKSVKTREYPLPLQMHVVVYTGDYTAITSEKRESTASSIT